MDKASAILVAAVLHFDAAVADMVAAVADMVAAETYVVAAMARVVTAMAQVLRIWCRTWRAGDSELPPYLVRALKSCSRWGGGRTYQESHGEQIHEGQHHNVAW